MPTIMILTADDLLSLLRGGSITRGPVILMPSTLDLDDIHAVLATMDRRIDAIRGRPQNGAMEGYDDGPGHV